MKQQCPICDSYRYDSRRGFLYCYACGFSPVDHSAKQLNDFDRWYDQQRVARLAADSERTLHGINYSTKEAKM